jgi:hypothetical protein
MIYVNRLCAWAPGITSSEEWNEWAQDKKEISLTGKGPELSYTEPMFRRRLSQISKMTIQVAHDLSLTDDIKIFFFSFRGELSRQFQINKMLIEENELSPASFSLSVFNAPAALAAMALGLKGGYSCVYPGNNSFAGSLEIAKAAIFGGNAEKIAFIYADEEVPKEYYHFFDSPPFAVSFGFVLSKNKDDNTMLPLPDGNEKPLTYLKRIISGGLNVSP